MTNTIVNNGLSPVVLLVRFSFLASRRNANENETAPIQQIVSAKEIMLHNNATSLKSQNRTYSQLSLENLQRYRERGEGGNRIEIQKWTRYFTLAIITF